jgi:hypothetical protein
MSPAASTRDDIPFVIVAVPVMGILLELVIGQRREPAVIAVAVGIVANSDDSVRQET